VAKIKDVAKHANVSVSTVSYVLSGKRPISQETRERVYESIRALGYQPHAGARALASKRTNVFALVMPLHSGVYVPVVMQFVSAVVTRAREVDHDVLILTKDEGEEGLHRVQERSLADAMIVMDVEMHDARLPFLRTLQTPTVLIGFPEKADGLICVDLDFTAAGARCLDHLADLGHTCVGLIGSPYVVYQRETGFATRVAEGVRNAARRRNVRLTTHPCDPTPEGVRQAVSDLLGQQPGMTGLIVHNEAIIEPLLAALRERGRQVPQDISVVAIGPADLARRFDLTAVELPTHEIGRRAVDLAMAQLAEATVPPATLLEPRLTVRGSSQPRTSTRLTGRPVVGAALTKTGPQPGLRRR